MSVSLSAALPLALKHAVEDTAKQWESSGNTARLWKKDPSLWTNSGEEKWLGWLDLVDQQLGVRFTV